MPAPTPATADRNLLLGILFIATVLFARQGLIGIARRGIGSWPRST